MWGIIGGSGFENFEGFQVIEELPRETPFGSASSGFKRVSIDGHEALFLSRHGKHHEDLPSEINYRANIYALKKAGAKAILSFSAVGSLKAEFKPGDMVVPTQYIDRTKGLRASTFLGAGVVGHISLADPTSHELVERFQGCILNTELNPIGDTSLQFKDIHFGATYICIEGPNFSTRAESKMYRQWGATLIGMTHYPEYALIREAGMPYLPCCFVTDYDCWDESLPHVTLDEVIQVMRKNNEKAYGHLRLILNQGLAFYEDVDYSQKGLRGNLLSDISTVSQGVRDKLQIFL